LRNHRSIWHCWTSTERTFRRQRTVSSSHPETALLSAVDLLCPPTVPTGSICSLPSMKCSGRKRIPRRYQVSDNCHLCNYSRYCGSASLPLGAVSASFAATNHPACVRLAVTSLIAHLAMCLFGHSDSSLMSGFFIAASRVARAVSRRLTVTRYGFRLPV